MKYILLLLIYGCSTIKHNSTKYLVKTSHGIYVCAEYYQSEYGSSAKNCYDIITKRKVSMIPSPFKVEEL
jgi:hypothetical protein